MLDQILNIPGASDPHSSRSINALITTLALSNSGCSWDGEIYFDAFDFDLPETEAAISEVTHVLRNQEGVQALLESANTSVVRFTLKLIAALMQPDDWVGSARPIPPASFIFNIVSTGNWAKLSRQVQSSSPCNHQCSKCQTAMKMIRFGLRQYLH